MRPAPLAVLWLSVVLASACSRPAPPPAADDFVLHSEDDLLTAWGDPEDISWEDDGTKVLLYLEEVKLDHSPDLIVSRTYVPDNNGRLISGPITTFDTYEANEYITEHRFWVNPDGIIIRSESRPH
jgi:hypothetical protein